MQRDDPTRRFERNVGARLRTLGRRFRFYLALDGLAVLCAASMSAVLLTLLVDRTLMLGRDMRFVQLASLLTLLGIVVWRYLVRPLRIPIRLMDLALLVERTYPQLKSRLVSAVEFADPASSSHATRQRSRAMMSAVIDEAEIELTELSLNRPLDHGRAGRKGVLILASLFAFGVLVLAEQETMGLWFHRNVLLEDVAWPMRHSLVVEGLEEGKLRVPRGDDLVLSARVEEGYAVPRQVYVDYDMDSGVSGREQMVATQGQTVRFAHTFERMSRNMRCRITGGDARVEPFEIEVVDRPRVASVTLHIEPPAYTKAESYDLREGQTVAEALRGSRISMRITTQKDIASARLIRQTGSEETIIETVDKQGPRAFIGRDLPLDSATYHFALTDTEGMTNQSDRIAPVRFSVRLLADQPPRVKMKIRGAGEMITPQAILPIETDFNDVYGLASASLAVTLTREVETRSTEPLAGFEPGTVTFAKTSLWSLPAHDVQEGDGLTLQGEASDYDNISGPNVGESTPFHFNVVSREELLAELNRREQEYRQDFERLIRRQEDLRADLAAASATSPETDSRKRAQEWARLSRRQRDHAGRVNTIRLQFEQVLSELQINQLATPAIEKRLGKEIVEPLDDLARQMMPDAADKIDVLARNPLPDSSQSADDAQWAVQEQMKRILANMVKWEGFQEAVALLREVMKVQDDLNEETEKAIEKAFFGTDSPNDASKDGENP